MLKINYDDNEMINNSSKKCITGKNQRNGLSYTFIIRYFPHFPKGKRYTVIAGCRTKTIEEACRHWFQPEHHSREKRIKTLRKLFKLYGVEKRRIPKQYRAELGYK